MSLMMPPQLTMIVTITTVLFIIATTTVTATPITIADNKNNEMKQEVENIIVTKQHKVGNHHQPLVVAKTETTMMKTHDGYVFGDNSSTEQKSANFSKPELIDSIFNVSVYSV